MCKVSANKDHDNIADFSKKKYIMSYNEFQKEPLSVTLLATLNVAS